MESKEFYGLSFVIIIVLSGGAVAEMNYLSSTVPDWFIEDYTPLDPEDFNDDDNPSGPAEPVEVTVLTNEGHTTEGDSSEFTFKLDQDGVLSLTLSLAWQDDLGAPDELGLTLIYEDKEVGSVQGSSGALELVFDQGNATAFKGEYVIRISALDCPGAVAGFPFDRDNGNDWALTVVATIQE